jgi:tetratricopeptide (TPR) repeat protein
LGDPMHASLGSALNDYGVSLTRVGRHAEALDALREARNIFGWHLGTGDPTMMRVGRSIASCLRQLGRFDEARSEIGPVIARYRELDRGVDVAEALRELADLERDVGNHAAAVAHYTEARALIAVAVGEAHPTLRRFDHWTAEAYELAGEHAAARATWERALAPPHSVAAYGPTMEGPARAGLGRVLLALGETDLARAELERALPLLESARGADHPETTAVRALLAR